MPDAIITSTESTFGTISGTFAADQSTITGTVTGIVAGTLSGSVGVPGPQGPTGPQGPEGPPGPPGTGGTWGSIVGTLSNQTDLQTALNLKAPLTSPALTGVPTTPTAATLTSTTQIASTAFVQQELAAGTAVAKNLEVYVRNQTGSTLAAGAIVYINGATGNRPTITLAQANNDANSAQTFGFVKASIANNGFGYVIVRGECENLDTQALTEGAQLYLSPTTAGAWTTTKPSAPQHLVYVGIVVRAHATQGVILVAVQNGYELDELHDVSIVSKANNDLIAYDSATTLWKNKSIGTLGLATQAWVDAQGYLQAGALTGYALESWVTAGFYPLTGNPSGFLTSASLSGYLTKADNLASVASVSTARDNLGLGSLSTPTFAGVTVQGLGSNVANLTPTSLSLTHTTAGTFTIQPTVGITFPDATVQTTAFPAGADVPTGGTTGQALVKVSNSNYDVDWATISTSATWGSITGTLSSQTDLQTALDGKYSTSNPAGYITSSALTGYATESFVTSQGYITSAALSPYLTSATAASTYQTLSGMSSYLTTSAAASTYYLQTNPAGYITSSALSPYLTSATAASTYQTLSGMSSYLTTATAASTYATILEPSVDGILTVEPSGSNSATVQVNQDANNYIHLRPGVGQIAMVYGGSTKWFFNDTYLQFPGGTQQTVAYPGPSGFLLKADNLSGLANTATARTNLGLGTMATETASNYLTTSAAASTYLTQSSAASTYYLQTNPAGYITSSALSPYLTTATAASTYAPLASPSLTGTPTAPTATAGTNTTQIATTAFVQAAVSGGSGAVWGSITGTLSSQTDLQTALNAKLDSTTAASTYQTIAGMSSYLTTASAASTYAPLASPALTGVPTAPTATVGTNTTQIATTAFVLANAGSTSFATNAQVITGTSTTTSLNPGHAGFLKADPRLRQLGQCNNTNVAGSGAITGSSGLNYSREMYLASLAAGRAAFTYGYFGSEAGMLTSKANKNQINFSKKIWVSGSCSPGITSGGTSYMGDANTVARVSFGGYSSNATGDMTQKGIGWRKTGGAASFINLSVHNGTTLTNVATTVAVAANEVIDWLIYSDGTGNVTLYINGTQAATTSAGPTGTTTAGYNAYLEQVEGTGTPTVRHAMHAHSGWIYLGD